MRYKEALDWVIGYIECSGEIKGGSVIDRSIKTLQELVDKSIPKRPKGISQTYEGRVANCPSCEKFISEKTDKYYHSDKDCLQKLDWDCGQKLYWKEVLENE